MKQLMILLFAGMAVMAETTVIEVEGMTCPLCTSAIKHSLKKVKGVTQAKVKLNSRKATVTHEGNISTEALLEAVKKAGYSGKILKEN